MPKFRIDYSYQQGPDHHNPDYGNPDVPLETKHDSRTFEAADREEAERKFRKSVVYGRVDGIREIKE